LFINIFYNIFIIKESFAGGEVRRALKEEKRSFMAGFRGGFIDRRRKI
jgi:hypothetical protein